MRTFLRVLLWSAVFIAAIAALLFVFGVWVANYAPGFGRGAANTIGLGLPGLAALWILILGFRHAVSRGAVRACTISAGLLAGIVLTGGLLIWRFVKRRPPPGPVSPSRGV